MACTSCQGLRGVGDGGGVLTSDPTNNNDLSAMAACAAARSNSQLVTLATSGLVHLLFSDSVYNGLTSNEKKALNDCLINAVLIVSNEGTYESAGKKLGDAVVQELVLAWGEQVRKSHPGNRAGISEEWILGRSKGAASVLAIFTYIAYALNQGGTDWAKDSKQCKRLGKFMLAAKILKSKLEKASAGFPIVLSDFDIISNKANGIKASDVRALHKSGASGGSSGNAQSGPATCQEEIKTIKKVNGASTLYSYKNPSCEEFTFGKMGNGTWSLTGWSTWYGNNLPNLCADIKMVGKQLGIDIISNKCPKEILPGGSYPSDDGSDQVSHSIPVVEEEPSKILLYVGIGAGVLALIGGGIYFATRNR